MLANILGTPTAWLQVEGSADGAPARRGPTAANSLLPRNADCGEVTPDEPTLLSCVREAVALGAFSVVFQPILEAGCGRIVGAEALLRWRNATHKANSPSEFVPVLESSNLINHVGAKALLEACLKTRDLVAGDAPLKLCVNISPTQFDDPALVERIGSVLRDTAFSPDRLELEITENVIEDFPRAKATVVALRTLGVGVLIDDFGVGYSSLGHLKNLPVSGLKLDRSFVTGVLKNRHDRLITESIIKLAHDLRLEIVAEGVEDVAHEHWLRARGVDRLQGFLYSEGVSALKFAKMLRVQPFEWTRTRESKPARRIAGQEDDCA